MCLAGALERGALGPDRGRLPRHELPPPGLAAVEGLVIAVVVGTDREEPDNDDPECGAEHHPEGENEHSRFCLSALLARSVFLGDRDARDVPPLPCLMDPPHAVEARDVRKQFGSVTALDGLTLEVNAGEIYGLLGPNGSGKTTLIRALAGLVRADAGELRVFGAAPRAAVGVGAIGYMPQAPALYGDLSVDENLRFFAALQGLTDVGPRIEEALRRVDLLDRRRSAVGTLSGGMRTRISLAATLLHQPRLLLLDEPTVGVDPALRREFWEHFRALASSGVTLLVSSHVMDEAARCDDLVLMRAGRIVGRGSAEDIRRQTGTDDLEAAFLRLAEAGGDDR